MKKLYVWMLPFCALMMVLATNVNAAGGQKTKAQILAKAWEEYGFQNWEKSKLLFEEALSGKPTDEQKLQARVGVIFILQYRAPGQDHEAAIVAYDSLIKELPADHSILPFLLMNKGYAYVAKQTPDLEKARASYRKALSMLEDKKSFLAQQIMLRLLETYLTNSDEKNLAEGLGVAKEVVAQMAGGRYESAAHSCYASIAFLNGDNKLGLEELIKEYNSGISSRSIKETVLFRIARMYDTEFKNYKQAAKYYRIYIKELPTSGKAYYCKLRAEELDKGVIDSEILKGSILRKREKAAEEAEKAAKAAKAKAAKKAAKKEKPAVSDASKTAPAE